MRLTIQDLFRRAARSPHVVTNSRFGPGFVDASALNQNLWRAMYFPISWPLLANAFADLKNGNATLTYEIWAMMGKHNPPTPHFFGHHPRDQPNMPYMDFPVVGCLDSNGTGNRLASRQAKIDFARRIQKVSFSGEIWSA